MVPKIHAKFRKRHGVPYAIEQLSGRQFRCRHCNKVFLREKEIEAHLRLVVTSDERGKAKVSPNAPDLSSTIEVRVLYAYDIVDKMKRQWLKLKSGDQYDGI